MSKRTRFIGLLLVMQTGCLAAGVWLQFFCVRWSTRNVLIKRDLGEMGEQAGALAKQLSPGESADVAQAAKNGGLAPALTQEGRGAVLVDSSWKIKSALTTPAGPPLEGRQLRWISRAGLESPPGGAKYGELLLNNELHFGASLALPGQSGFLVVHRNESAMEAEVASVLSGVSGVSLMTLLWTSALLGICGFLAAGRFCDEVDHERSRSLSNAMRQRQNLIRTRDAVIFGLAKLAESRDPETGDHLDRISMYATALATALMRRPEFCDRVTPSFVRLIGISAALHDIGKVGVEDRILLKPGKLTASERALIEDHSRIGGDCLREIERRLGQSNFLQMARDIAFSHHERWDGSGYPFGLLGEQTPLAARIVAIGDVYDALRSRRVYKEPIPHEQCVAIIREGAGTQFDPSIVEVWLTIAGQFHRIFEKYGKSRTQIFEKQVSDDAGTPDESFSPEMAVAARPLGLDGCSRPGGMSKDIPPRRDRSFVKGKRIRRLKPEA